MKKIFQRGFLFFLLVPNEIALANVYSCEAHGIDRAGTLSIELIDGKIKSFSSTLEVQAGAIKPAGVVMVTIKGRYAGAIIVGPKDSEDEESSLVGGFFYRDPDELIWTQTPSEGTPAKIGSADCIFKLERTITEDAALVPMTP